MPQRPRLTLLSARPKADDPALRRTLAAILEQPVAPTPVPPAPPQPMSRNRAANGIVAPVAERKDQMERIAGSLEDVARLLRGRGLSALFRNEPDPLNQRLLRVITDHMAAHASG